MFSFKQSESKSMGPTFPKFFDDFPRFYSTSLTGNDAEWNNRRHRVLIDKCRHVIEGKRLWDFGSHDGRWAFAALQSGSSHVTCIEPGHQLVAATAENFKHYGVDSGRFEIAQMGAVEFLEQAKPTADTAFLFGMLTLISEQPAFFGRLRRLGVKNLVIDTHILPNEARPVLELFRAIVQDGNAIVSEKTQFGDWMIGATSSLSALQLMLSHFGWNSTMLDWTEMQRHPDMNDYTIGRRVSILATTE